jgi:hypothetical protein
VQIREYLETPGVQDRLEAQQRFARSTERLPEFPPAPVDLPDFRGYLLENWVNPTEEELLDNIETIDVVKSPFR